MQIGEMVTIFFSSITLSQQQTTYILVHYRTCPARSAKMDVKNMVHDMLSSFLIIFKKELYISFLLTSW